MTAVAAAARLLHDFVEDRSFSLQLLSDIDLRRVARGPVNVGSLVALKPARDVNVAGSSDALRILSDNWSDGSAGKNARPNASAQTTIQAAIFSGHTGSTLAGQGGGQFENFPASSRRSRTGSSRSTAPLCRYGSPSTRTARGSAATTTNRPDRDWKFDDRFLDPENLPTRTPTVGQVMRMGFARRY